MAERIDPVRLRALVRDLEAHGASVVPGVIRQLRAWGVISKIHEGKPAESFTPDEVVQWYAGQLLDILERGFDPFYLLPLYNMLDTWVPAASLPCVKCQQPTGMPALDRRTIPAGCRASLIVMCSACTAAAAGPWLDWWKEPGDG